MAKEKQQIDLRGPIMGKDKRFFMPKNIQQN